MVMINTYAKLNVEGQLVHEMELKLTDRRTRPIALRSPLMRSLIQLSLASLRGRLIEYQLQLG